MSEVDEGAGLRPRPAAPSGGRCRWSGVPAELTPLTAGELAYVRERVAVLTEGLEPGPFRVQGDDRDERWFWLDNEAGDTSFPGKADVELWFNWTPRLLATIEKLQLEQVRLLADLAAARAEGSDPQVGHHTIEAQDEP